MKKLVKWLFVPALVFVGLALIGPMDAEAARWRRHARWGGYGYAPYYHVAPLVVRAPGVRVVVPAPRVHVGVGPGIHVLAPGVGIHVGPVYRPYYWGSYYRSWW